MNVPALELTNVAVRYEPDVPPVLAGVSLSIAPGERVALIGLNGSGKTTLLAAVAGLVVHDGEIRVDGVALSHRTLAGIRDRLGFLFNVPEDQILFPRVVDDVSFGLVRRKISAREAAQQAAPVMERLGIGHLAREPVHHLSHGQKQRVALAGALVAAPPLLLLDEPSAGLDPPGKRQLASLLKTLPAAMLIATHDLDFAASLCSRFILLADGGKRLETAVFSDIVDFWRIRET